MTYVDSNIVNEDITEKRTQNGPLGTPDRAILGLATIVIYKERCVSQITPQKLNKIQRELETKKF